MRPTLLFSLATFALGACGGTPPPPPSSAPPTPAPAAVAPVVVAAPAAAPAPAFAAPIDALFAPYASGHSPGCAVGVYRAGEVLYANGYGFADLEHDARITDTTPFALASVSKQFTAAAVVLLAQDGKLSVDDDVRKFIPELPDLGRPVTLAELLHHTSGVRDFGLLLQIQGSHSDDFRTTDDMLWLLAHQRGLNFAPGSRYLYSNSGYVLLSVVVQRVAGKPLAALLEERIFGPLGMSDTHVNDDHTRIVPGRAVGYEKWDAGFAIAMGNSEVTGPGGVVSTIRDLAKWDANFYAPKVGGQALVDALRTKGKLSDGTTIDYAMGLVEQQTHGRTVETHSGVFAGYRTILARYPAERMTVAILCNDSSAKSSELRDRVAAIVLPQLSGPDPKDEAAPAAPPALGVDPATIAGVYLDVEVGGLLVVEAKDGGLRLRKALHGESKLELIAVGPRELAVKASPETRYVFEPAAGKVAARLLRRADGGPADVFVRIEPVESVSTSTLAGYAARYGSDEVTRDVVVLVKDAKLRWGPLGRAPTKQPLQPVTKDVFLLGDDAGDCVFERDARGRVEAVVFNSERTHGVRLGRR